MVVITSSFRPLGSLPRSDQGINLNLRAGRSSEAIVELDVGTYRYRGPRGGERMTHVSCGDARWRSLELAHFHLQIARAEFPSSEEAKPWVQASLAIRRNRHDARWKGTNGDHGSVG